MHTFCRQLLDAACAAMFFGAVSLPALAEDWPSRPITIVVPYAPGGNTDLMARMIAKQIGATLHTSVIVENRAGAAGIIATEYVARASPNGYTLLMGTITQISTAPFTNKIRYDPLRDFVPVANVGGNPMVMTVTATLPIRNIADLIAYAKQHPGQVTIGNSGLGGISHLASLVFQSYAGVKMIDVPYKGGLPALTDVMAGTTDLYEGNLSEVLPHRHDPQVRMLSVSSDHRVNALPDVPTLSETIPGIPAVATWNGLLAPAGTPRPVVDKIATAVLAAEHDPGFQSDLEKLGVTPIPEITDAFGQRIKNDIAFWRPIFKQAGIEPQ